MHPFKVCNPHLQAASVLLCSKLIRLKLGSHLTQLIMNSL